MGGETNGVGLLSNGSFGERTMRDKEKYLELISSVDQAIALTEAIGLTTAVHILRMARLEIDLAELHAAGEADIRDLNVRLGGEKLSS